MPYKRLSCCLRTLIQPHSFSSSLSEQPPQLARLAGRLMPARWSVRLCRATSAACCAWTPAAAACRAPSVMRSPGPKRRPPATLGSAAERLMRVGVARLSSCR